MTRTKRPKRVDLVQRGCAASSQELAATLPSTGWQSSTGSYQMEIYRSGELDESLKGWIFDCYDANMHDLTENSSMGWHPEEKQDELFHADSRFLLVRRTDVETHQNELVAFSMFRFDWEDCVDEDILERTKRKRNDQCEVLYCYELQVASVGRRHGIGAELIKALDLLARRYNMWKIMLTCLKANDSAMTFYLKNGFEVDGVSPSSPWVDDDDDDDLWDEDEDEYECDYEIMSRRV